LSGAVCRHSPEFAVFCIGLGPNLGPQEPQLSDANQGGCWKAAVRSGHTRSLAALHGQSQRALTRAFPIGGAYLKDAERLREEGAFIRCVILDHELKREYQQFLQERNRGKSESDGRPDRTPEEIHRWAVEHELPDNDGHVQFPDARIEYEDRDGHVRTLDIEVETLHYRGAHASSKASSGFSRHSAGTARVVGSRSGGGGGAGRGRRCGLTITAGTGKSGGRSPDPRLADANGEAAPSAIRLSPAANTPHVLASPT
jgi:hypothetical protein